MKAVISHFSSQCLSCEQVDRGIVGKLRNRKQGRARKGWRCLPCLIEFRLRGRFYQEGVTMSPACFLPIARSFAYYWGYFFAWLHWMREAVIRVHPWLPLRCCCLLVTGRLATDQHACLSREHAALTILPCSLPPALPTPPFFIRLR